jgi:hypothetical protein
LAARVDHPHGAFDVRCTEHGCRTRSRGSSDTSCCWARLRGGHNFGKLTVGPEGQIGGTDAYDEQRIGLFADFRFDEPWVRATIFGRTSFQRQEWHPRRQGRRLRNFERWPGLLKTEGRAVRNMRFPPSTCALAGRVGNGDPAAGFPELAGVVYFNEVETYPCLRHTATRIGGPARGPASA